MSLSLSIRKFIVFKDKAQNKKVISWDDAEEITHIEKIEKNKIDWDDVITMGYARYSFEEQKWQIDDRYVLSEAIGESGETDLIIDHLKKCFSPCTEKQLPFKQKERD